MKPDPDLQYILDKAFAPLIKADGRDPVMVLSEQAACRKPQTDPMLLALFEYRAGPARSRMEIARPHSRKVNVLKGGKP